MTHASESRWAGSQTLEAWGFVRRMLDTGGRQRGFVVLRWLDNPAAPAVRARVVAVGDVRTP